MTSKLIAQIALTATIAAILMHFGLALILACVIGFVVALFAQIAWGIMFPRYENEMVTLPNGKTQGY